MFYLSFTGQSKGFSGLVQILHRQDGGGYRLYHYDPTTAGAVVIVLLFTTTTVFHVWQMLYTKCWIAIPLVLGGLLQVVGYSARAVSGTESPDWTLGPYIIQAIFLLVAPALFAATVYMEFGRLVKIVDGEAHTAIRHKWITKIFVIGDLLSFLLQGGGGGYQSSGTLEALNLGAKIIIAGLFVQLLFFGVFIGVAGDWHVKMIRLPPRQAHFHPWKKHMHVLFGTSLLIMIRSIFRVAEYLQGNDGYILAHEAYLYVFDAVLMLSVMAVFNMVHPSRAIALEHSKSSDRDTLDIHLDRYYSGT